MSIFNLVKFNTFSFEYRKALTSVIQISFQINKQEIPIKVFKFSFVRVSV